MGKEQRERSAWLGDGGLDGVHQRINPNIGGHSVGERDSQLRVEKGDRWLRTSLSQRHLGMGCGIGDKRMALYLATCARRGGNCDGWQEGAGETSAHRAGNPKITEGPTVGEDKVRPFGRVHRGAAAQCNQYLGTKLPGQFQTRLHIVRGRVLMNSSEDRGCHARRA